MRGALARLEDEGLVETEPQRFTRVTPLQRADARALFPVVATLHALATELAVPRLTTAELRRLREHNDLHRTALAAGDAGGAYAADHRFHDVFVAAAGNAEVGRALARLLPRLRRLELLHRGALPGRRTLAQHEAIIARASGGDAAGAASAARENWLTCGGLFERSLA